MKPKPASRVSALPAFVVILLLSNLRLALQGQAWFQWSGPGSGNWDLDASLICSAGATPGFTLQPSP